jgi:hypothetical protein
LFYDGGSLLFGEDPLDQLVCVDGASILELLKEDVTHAFIGYF